MDIDIGEETKREKKGYLSILLANQNSTTNHNEQTKIKDTLEKNKRLINTPELICRSKVRSKSMKRDGEKGTQLNSCLLFESEVFR